MTRKPDWLPRWFTGLIVDKPFQLQPTARKATSTELTVSDHQINPEDDLLLFVRMVNKAYHEKRKKRVSR